ncbi:DUF1269 domain-containing protein [Stenomitos frigidus]|uniref:DUF1269 domain-containing family protein n=1 Tax=Stenomitos frigidus ULC18 TaxID=2107698 RepID=A0A2T1E735_9CYAN|nr:DUF1269 domain-containing protein [Stenomitos frigidus]PSB28552.1 hypothetical protein C7B82_13010 [Stenomitos frigidus ULC18]
MSRLVVVGFDDKFKAEEALLKLLKLEQEHLLALDDAVVAVKNADGKLRVKAYHDLTEPVPELGNELWGGIISAVVFHRELEISQGVFDPHFLLNVETALKPNSSALFVLVRSGEPEAVLTALAGVGGNVLSTAFSEAAQLKLQDALSAVA